MEKANCVSIYIEILLDYYEPHYYQIITIINLQEIN